MGINDLKLRRVKDARRKQKNGTGEGSHMVLAMQRTDPPRSFGVLEY